jgi:tRNA 5-methylaminomethyl-2-thiouridine biosynthesis bifunctional protein
VVPLVPGRLALDSRGVPYSESYGDVYHSADGGPEQAWAVFLAGNALPQAWRGRAAFTVVETGFGLGVNFLVTCGALLADERSPARLHYVSAEKHPLPKHELAAALARYPELSPLAGELLAAWPLALPGFHRLHLARGRITLTLLLGDAQALLPQLEARADAFYLDGFAPEKNPALWSPAIMRELARLAAPGATLATWCVAGAVRAALVEAGFSVEKRPGFGRKREILAGSFPGQAEERAARARHAAIIGAGAAGTSCAERLAARGWAVTLIDRREAPAREASGNPAGLLRPLLNLEDGVNARLSRAALGYALRHLARLEDDGATWRASGVLQLARDAAQGARLERIVAVHGFPPELAGYVNAHEASRIAGRAVRGPGWWMPAAGWVAPESLCAANIARHGERIERRFSSEAVRLVGSHGVWRVEGARGALIAEAPVVILANAADARALAPGIELPLEAVRGQISLLPDAPGRNLAVPVCGDGMVSPLPRGGFCIGATLQRGDPDPSPRRADDAENLARAESLLPGFTAGADAAQLTGHAAFRASTPDRLPLVGALPADGLHAVLGLGMRGLVWAPLCAELLAAQLEGEPLPVERELASAIEARRFAPVTGTSGTRPGRPSPAPSIRG